MVRSFSTCRLEMEALLVCGTREQKSVGSDQESGLSQWSIQSEWQESSITSRALVLPRSEGFQRCGTFR